MVSLDILLNAMIILPVLRSGFQRPKTAEKLGVSQRLRSAHPVIFAVSTALVTLRTMFLPKLRGKNGPCGAATAQLIGFRCQVSGFRELRCEILTPEH